MEMTPEQLGALMVELTVFTLALIFVLFIILENDNKRD